MGTEGCVVADSVKLGFNLVKSDNKSKILLVNSCNRMAKEINRELLKKLPDCSVTFAPSLSLAKLLIAKGSFNLIICSAIMPDGSSILLKEYLEKIKSQASLVVIKNNNLLLDIGQILASRQPAIKLNSDSKIKELGADLRNDLNNPLQEILTMVHVASSQNEKTEITSQALEAIGKAATNLAGVVKQIEGKIRVAINQ